MKELVFIHGRSQQHLDPASLKQQWLTALKKGLAKIGQSLPISDEQVHFPYYGDTLEQLCQGQTPEEAAKIIVQGGIADDIERQFAAQMVIEIGHQLGITDEQAEALLGENVIHQGIENWPVVLGFLRAMDRIPGINSQAISLATHDVYQYLRQSGVNTVINNGVMKAIRPNIETVLVSHSLGTVVAYNLLRTPDTNFRITQFITLGSPLAISPIKRALAPLGRPACISKWFNARDKSDVVALFPLDKDHFPPQPILNKNSVQNPPEDPHSIEGYLSDTDVASSTYTALI
jgi:hypothetical protein